MENEHNQNKSIHKNMCIHLIDVNPFVRNYDPCLAFKINLSSSSTFIEAVFFDEILALIF
jgi:hypothetical protein